MEACQSGTTVEVYWPFAASEYCAARLMRGDRGSIETGVTLDLSSLLMNRVRWLLASLNESIENCQHEENRRAANAREYNRSDLGRFA
jgi:hypothetical protein